MTGLDASDARTVSGARQVVDGLHLSGNGDHGLNRRPSKADLTPIDPAELAAWTAKNRRAREHYYAAPNALIVSRMAN